MPSSCPQMIVEKDAGVGWMIFNNPERRNALSYDMRVAMIDILDDFARDDTVRVVVMTGAGDKAFVSGIDLSPSENDQLASEQPGGPPSLGERVHRAFEGFEKPLIAMIRGFCLGGGVAIALHADLRIASETAEFGIPAGRLGIAYPFRAVRKLVDAVGAANAKEILFTADRFDAAAALRMGLVNRVEADAELDRMVRQIASRIGECAPLSVRAAKAMVEQALKDVDVRDVALCDTLFNRCLASEDYQEGRRAFREKRRPIFVGR